MLYLWYMGEFDGGGRERGVQSSNTNIHEWTIWRTRITGRIHAVLKYFRAISLSESSANFPNQNN